MVENLGAILNAEGINKGGTNGDICTVILKDLINHLNGKGKSDNVEARALDLGDNA